MKVSDYADIISKLSNPDTSAEGLVELNDRLKIDEEEYTKITESVNTLRDTNSKLALRVTENITQTTGEEGEETPDPYDTFESALKEAYGNG